MNFQNPSPYDKLFRDPLLSHFPNSPRLKDSAEGTPISASILHCSHHLMLFLFHTDHNDLSSHVHNTISEIIDASTQQLPASNFSFNLRLIRKITVSEVNLDFTNYSHTQEALIESSLPKLVLSRLITLSKVVEA